MIHRFTRSLLIVVPTYVAVAAGCGNASDEHTSFEETAAAREADQSTPAPADDPRLVPTCTNAGDFTESNAGFPVHELATCADGDGFTFEDAVAACGGNVKYFGYFCSDFPADSPYRPNDERAWTAYLGCCEHPASCTDGIQNQGETGVDCGGPCAPCAGKIVVNHDEWTLSDFGIAQAPAAATFATNIASWFTGGKPGNFLVFSSNFGLVGTGLANAMTGAGHTWTVSTAVPFTVASLQQFNGVFLGGDAADNDVLIQYVATGGNVYLAGGTGLGGAVAEAARWNTFLNAYGLQFGDAYNLVTGTFPVSSSHPIFVGVNALFYDNGNSISVLDPANPRTQILTSVSGQGLVAVFQ